MIEIKSLEKYIQIVRELHNSEGCGSVEKVFYRGQPNSEYRLIPSLGRTIEGHSVESETYEALENEIKKRSVLEYPDVFTGNNDNDILALLRHYGMPTRLLDVTENPLVALYFACSHNSIQDKNSDGEVFAFKSGDKVKTYFSDDIKANGANEIVFVRTKVSSSRQRQQQGLYMKFPTGHLQEITKDDDLVSERIIIPSDDKETIKQELKMMGISAKTLFPDNLDICCKELLEEITKDAYSC